MSPEVKKPDTSRETQQAWERLVDDLFALDADHPFLAQVTDDDDPATPENTVKLRNSRRPSGLGRSPKPFEARVMSLSTIPARLDAAVATVKAALPDLLRTLAESDDASLDALTALFATTMQDMAQFGAGEVRLELSRQGADLEGIPDTPSVDQDITKEAAQSATDLQQELSAIKDEIYRKLRKRRVTAAKKRKAAFEALERRLNALSNRAARRVVHDAFSKGRSKEIRALSNPTEAVHLRRRGKAISVDTLVQTSVLDANSCEECADVDGEVMELGSERQQELEPPYYRCLGGDNCRCLQLPVLSGEHE